MSDDIASRIGWGVVLDGEAFDLEEWKGALKQPFDPWLMETEDGLILRSSRLDPTTPASEAYESAKALMNEVNGALGVSHRARVVRLHSIAEILSDGTRPRRLLFAQLHEEVRAKARATTVDLDPDGKPKPPPPPEPSNPQRWLSIAAEDALLADALTFFGRGDDWFDTYKALECLIGRFGGGKEADFLALGWASTDNVKLLRQHDARHVGFYIYRNRAWASPCRPGPRAVPRGSEAFCA
jgi:hypothetical protein